MELIIKTPKKKVLVNITDKVMGIIKKNRKDGAYLLFVPHTTAGITINEAADPDVAKDIVMGLDRIVSENAPYKHMEGNSPAHIKASMMGSSVFLVVKNQEPVLGTWQGIFFCEFDGPRSRKLRITFLGDY